MKAPIQSGEGSFVGLGGTANLAVLGGNLPPSRTGKAILINCGLPLTFDWRRGSAALPHPVGQSCRFALTEKWRDGDPFHLEQVGREFDFSARHSARTQPARREPSYLGLREEDSRTWPSAPRFTLHTSPPSP